MGAMDVKQNDSAHTPHAISADAMRKRNVHNGADPQLAEVDKNDGLGKGASKNDDEEMEKIINELPSWKDQLSLRGYIVGKSRALLLQPWYQLMMH